MMLKEFDLDNYLFGITEAELSEREIKQIKQQLKQEMMEIFYVVICHLWKLNNKFEIFFQNLYIAKYEYNT